jgi:hypothetical protein
MRKKVKFDWAELMAAFEDSGFDQSLCWVELCSLISQYLIWLAVFMNTILQ